MKGKIDTQGNLCIKRAGKYVIAECKKHVSCVVVKTASNTQTRLCGKCNHYCPLFGEPEQEGFEGVCFRTYLSLCCKEICFDEFTDERGDKKDRRKNDSYANNNN